MDTALIDELLEALLAELPERSAERVTLALEATDTSASLVPSARWWRGEEVLHHRPLAWQIYGAVVRRAMQGAQLDPWQFRRSQTGTHAGAWTVEAAGDRLERRRVTLRPLHPAPAVAGAAARTDALVSQLVDQAQREFRARQMRRPAHEDVNAEIPLLVRLMHMMLREAIDDGAQRIVVSAAGTELFFPDGNSSMDAGWLNGQWPEARRWLLQTSGLRPWERGPATAVIWLGLAGDRTVTWNVLVEPERVTLTLGEPIAPAVGSIVREEAPQRPALPVLLLAVLDAPKDLAPRAVYADWLLSQGDKRGTFISSQLAGQGLDEPVPKGAKQWCGSVGEIASHVRFAWGFLDRLSVWREDGSTLSQAVLRDPHWSTVRGLRVDRLSPVVATQLVTEAPLGSLEALSTATAIAGQPPQALAQLRTLSLVDPTVHTVAWAEKLSAPKLTALELELERFDAPDLNQPSIARFIALVVARPVPEVVVDEKAFPSVLRVARELPPTVERVSVPFISLRQQGAFQPGVVCTMYRASPGAPFADVVLHGDFNDLYRRALDILPLLSGLPLERIRFVTEPRALDRGREGVLRKAVAKHLPRVRIEIATGPREARLWWLSQTPPRLD